MGFLVPALVSAGLDSVRTTVLNELTSRVDGQPYGRANQRLFELAFPEPHPYFGFVVGRSADIRAATVDNVVRFYKSYYVPENAVLVFVGDVTPLTLKVLVRRFFGSLPRGANQAFVVEHGTSGSEGGNTVREVLEDSVAVPRVTVGWRVPPAFHAGGEDVSLDILALLLGDPSFGLLPQRLIEADHLVTSATCEHRRLRLSGLFRCDLLLRDRVDTAQVEVAFNRVLADLVEATPPAEVAAARVAWRANQLRKQEDILERARAIAWYAIVGGDATRATRDAIAHDEVTPAALGQVVGRYLQVGRRYTVIVNPRREP